MKAFGTTKARFSSSFPTLFSFLLTKPDFNPKTKDPTDSSVPTPEGDFPSPRPIIAKETGSTFVEILVVLAIVGVIATLTFPALTKAKEQALVSQEVSQLKQLATAHGLYLADHDDHEPGSSIPIILGGYAKKELVRSSFDPFPIGWANAERVGDQEPRTAYKDSFPTLRGSVGQQFFSHFRESQNGGWLIASGPILRKQKRAVLADGLTYRRLTFGGSVIQRTFPVVHRPDGTSSLDWSRLYSDDEVLKDLGY